MSIADRITSMTQHTKEAYDKIASLGADLTGINKNIDNIADVLDDVYEGYPKVTGSGTSMSISNCKKAGMEIEYKGNTSQVSTTGKNIFHQRETTTNNGVTYTKNADGSYNIKGTASSQANLYVDIPIADTEIISGETYTLSVNKTFPSSMTVIVEGYNGDTWVRNHVRVNTGETSATAVINLSGTTKVRQTIRVYNGSSIDIENLQIQLEKSSTPTPYEPYTNGPSPNSSYPQDVHVVKGNNTVKVSGKNLFMNLDSQTINGMTLTRNNNGTYSLSGTAAERTDFYIFGDMLSNGTYTLSCNKLITGCKVKVQDWDSYWLSELLSLNIETNLTDTKNISSYSGYRTRYVFEVSAGTYNETDIRIQLEEGSTATTYEAYTETNYSINLGSIELCKVDTYQDYIYKSNDKWYKKAYIGKVVLDGGSTNKFTQIFSTNTSGINRYRTNSMGIKMQPPGELGKVFCDKLVPKTIGNTWNLQQGISVSDALDTFLIYIEAIKTATLQQANTWLSNNNLLIYYVLETPTDIEITDTTLISQLEAIKYSMNGTTIITQTNEDKPFELDVKALRGE